MKPYQEQYLALLAAASRGSGPSADFRDQEAFVADARRRNRVAQAAVEEGTRLLREELFPVLDNILSASEEEVEELGAFAGKLMSGTLQADVGLHYRIHLALTTYARHWGKRDLLIRELYLLGMSLYNMETMLSPNPVRLFTSRERMCFAESGAYFDDDYGGVTDPETRGYIHRSIGNIALSYDTTDPLSAKRKLEAVTRSIRILSDPDVRAKTPELPWDLYLYKSHQERTTLLSYLRTGQAGPEAFAQVLESAQIVEDRQQKAAKEHHEPPAPRWQYAYIAARYHCGAMLLTELLDGLEALSLSREEDDMGDQSLFSHVSVPAIYLEYSRDLKDERYALRVPEQVRRMTKRLLSWITRAPSTDNNEQLMFYLRQFLYTYREYPGNMPFTEVLQNVVAARHPASFARSGIAGELARTLTLWAAEDCPEKLKGLPGAESTGDVIWHQDDLGAMARTAGRLYDIGMVHFLNLDASACRGLFEEEEALLQLHAYCGAELLSGCPSTQMYADVARGHHCSFDGKSGYPVDFAMADSPMRPLICITAVADALSAAAEDTFSRYRPGRPLEEIFRELEEGSGSRFAPFVVELLASKERRAFLAGAIPQWKREAYLEIGRRREEMR